MIKKVRLPFILRLYQDWQTLCQVKLQSSTMLTTMLRCRHWILISVWFRGTLETVKENPKQIFIHFPWEDFFCQSMLIHPASFFSLSQNTVINYMADRKLTHEKNPKISAMCNAAQDLITMNVERRDISALFSELPLWIWEPRDRAWPHHTNSIKCIRLPFNTYTFKHGLFPFFLSQSPVCSK